MARWSDALAYRNALPEERWGHGMTTLGPVLRREAAGMGGRSVGYVLPSGVMVAMRVLPSGARELRISRRQLPAPAAEGWLTEVRRVARSLGCEGWGEPKGGFGPIGGSPCAGSLRAGHRVIRCTGPGVGGQGCRRGGFVARG